MRERQEELMPKRITQFLTNDFIVLHAKFPETNTKNVYVIQWWLFDLFFFYKIAII